MMDPNQTSNYPITEGTHGLSSTIFDVTLTTAESDLDRLISDLFDGYVVILGVEYMLGTIMNGIILISLLKSPKLLKTPFYVIVAGLCASECLGGVATPLR